MTRDEEDTHPLLQICLEELRQESQYIGERLERVYVLQNTALLLTGGAGAIISILLAAGRQTGVTVDVTPYLFIMLAPPWILVPTALMVLRNHFYIDIAERYLADVVGKTITQIPNVPPNFKLRVSYTRDAILFRKRARWLFMSSIALAEYAIPSAMSGLFMLGFYVTKTNASQIELPEWVALGTDGLLLLYLAFAVFFGRAKRPHEEVFEPPTAGIGVLLRLLSPLSPWPLGKPPRPPGRRPGWA